jgi:hypothetical protein
MTSLPATEYTVLSWIRCVFGALWDADVLAGGRGWRCVRVCLGKVLKMIADIPCARMACFVRQWLAQGMQKLRSRKDSPGMHEQATQLVCKLEEMFNALNAVVAGEVFRAGQIICTSCMTHLWHALDTLDRAPRPRHTPFAFGGLVWCV